MQPSETSLYIGAIGIQPNALGGIRQKMSAIGVGLRELSSDDLALIIQRKAVDRAMLGVVAAGAAFDELSMAASDQKAAFFVEAFAPYKQDALADRVAALMRQRLVAASRAAAQAQIELSELRRMFDSAQRTQVMLENYLHRHGLVEPTRLFATVAGEVVERISADEGKRVQPLPHDAFGLVSITINLAAPLPRGTSLNVDLMLGVDRAHRWTIAGPRPAGELQLNLPQASLEEYRVPSLELSVTEGGAGSVDLALASQRITSRWSLQRAGESIGFPLALALDYAPPGTRPRARALAAATQDAPREKTGPILFDQWENIRYKADGMQFDWQVAIAEDAMLQAHPLLNGMMILRLEDLSPRDGHGVRVDIRLANEAAPRTGFAIALVPSDHRRPLDVSDIRLPWAAKRSDWFELNGKSDGRAFLAWEPEEVEGMSLALVTACLDKKADFAWARWGAIALER